MPIFNKTIYVLTVVLEYIDLYQSEWQHETNIWVGYPAFLPFCIAVVHLSIATVAN